MSDQEKKNNRIGMFTSVGVHAAVFIIFFFLMAWRAPNPPNPEYGIELNFGLDSQGSGEVQPLIPVGDDTEKDAETVEQTSEAQPEEVQPDVKEEVSDTKEKAVEKIDSKTESPIVVKEEKKETKKETKEKPEEVKQKEKVVAEYKKEGKTETSTKDASKKGEAGNQGDDGKTGDKGSEEGKLDAKALYGTPGGGGGGNGFGLAMTGWKWADEPRIPELPDNENGRVVFKIVCDETGEIVEITTVERSLSLRAEQILKDEIRKNSLERTSSAGRAPERSTGNIIFILKTK